MEHRLNSENSKKSVNKDGFNKIQLKSDSKLLPVGDISKIVKQTAEEFNLPYHASNTFIGALKHHFSHLKTMGRA